jgi:hypothetical protein
LRFFIAQAPPAATHQSEGLYFFRALRIMLRCPLKWGPINGCESTIYIKTDISGGPIGP